MESSVPDGPQRAAGSASGQPGAPTYPPGAHAQDYPPVHPSPVSANGGPHRHDGRSPKTGVLDRTRRAGGGGRWWLWAGRAVLWAFILVVIFNGVRAPFTRMLQPGGQSATSATEVTGYPESAASAYALEFANAYLTYGSGNLEQRSDVLAGFLPEGADPQLGWNGEGTLELESAQIAGVRAVDARHGIVTLSVQVDETWMRLSVPVYAQGDALVISGQPALLPRPPEAELPVAAEQPVDEATAAQLRRQLPGFFQAFAGSDTESLARYLAPGVSMTGFSGGVAFESLDSVVVPEGDDATRQVTATVTWQLQTGGNAGQLQQSYQLTVVKDDGDWYVKSIQGAPSAGFS